EQLDTIGTSWIIKQLSPEEKLVLATKYLYFNVNTPVSVSLMRDRSQKVVPFWLESSGFILTDMVVRNSHSSYEVWQKDFDTGQVELGINGFDKHRPVYFISVGAQDPDRKLEITSVFPKGQHFETMAAGAFTYHDWDELTLEEVPDELAGQVLFTTIRGRAREAHLTGAFRTTAYPSGLEPDQIMLSWVSDPSTSMDINWRSNSSVTEGMVKYWESGTMDTLLAVADMNIMEDRLLQNDRYVHRFTAHLDQLQAGTQYYYQVGSELGAWSGAASFQTEDNRDENFSFIWFGDTHKSKHWGDLIQHSFQKFPDVAFYSIAGDLVSTGLNRDDWDQLIDVSGPVLQYKPLMPVPGNHDSQDGLGAWMYQEMFALPENGPEELSPELSYSFMFKNAFFLMIDVTSPLELQSRWIEEQLSNTDALWKFAMFHFPPYNYEEDYSEIRKQWCTLFDTYHVDMVMSGHTHYYMRSLPIFNEEVVEHHSQGTVYVISVGIPGNHENMPEEEYAEVRDGQGWLYQHMEINGDRLIYKSLDINGNTKDEFVIEK
ncbi:MAG: metallophosphoesterase family protein, partial [Bacteroidota bacterium]|nr:metallophosphoesterase family protein [Bacteroidota bacterium]